MGGDSAGQRPGLSTFSSCPRSEPCHRPETWAQHGGLRLGGLARPAGGNSRKNAGGSTEGLGRWGAGAPWGAASSVEWPSLCSVQALGQQGGFSASPTSCGYLFGMGVLWASSFRPGSPEMRLSGTAAGSQWAEFREGREGAGLR